MASVHSLFYSQDGDKQTLHRRIVPDQLQRDTQEERWNDLCEHLKEDLQEKTGYVISSWLQGSYKLKTQVRPKSKDGEFDIDLGIYFNWPGKPDDGRHSPEELKSLVQDSLAAYKAEADEVVEVVIPPKERCSRVRFSNNFHIDVPSYHLDSARDARALATETNGWEDSDPKAFYLWFCGHFADEDATQVRRLIRYLKMWAALRLAPPPPSILLTVLVAEAYLGLPDSQLNGDDVAIRNVAQAISERLEGDQKVPNPANPDEDLNRLNSGETQLFLHKLKELVAVADRAAAVGAEVEAAAIWVEAFGHFFPSAIPDPASAESRAIANVRFVPEVYIKATSQDNPNVTVDGHNGILGVPKKCDIVFTLTNASKLPSNSWVQWTVRNEGEEAEFRNDLGHAAGTHRWKADEVSEYRGTQYMDIVVYSPLREVLGYRRVPVEIIGTFVPPRNPRKPDHARIPKR